MLYSVLSFVLGVFITTWYLVFDLSFNFDRAMTSNIVIAAATAVAAAIYFDSARNQRKDRLWEINKDSLLRLYKDLADTIAISSTHSIREVSASESSDEQSISDDVATGGEREICQKFNEMAADFLNLHKPLLSSDLILALEEYQAAEAQIKTKFEFDAEFKFKGQSEQLIAQKALQVVLAKFIQNVSGA